jgi:hypothetical protein
MILDRWNDGRVHVHIDALHELGFLRVQLDPVDFPWIRFAIGGIAKTKPNVLEWGERRRGFDDRQWTGRILPTARVGPVSNRSRGEGKGHKET